MTVKEANTTPHIAYGTRVALNVYGVLEFTMVLCICNVLV